MFMVGNKEISSEHNQRARKRKRLNYFSVMKLFSYYTEEKKCFDVRYIPYLPIYTMYFSHLKLLMKRSTCYTTSNIST